MKFRFDPLIIKQALRAIIKIKSHIYLSFKRLWALRQRRHILNRLPLVCLDGDFGVSVADLILRMGLTLKLKRWDKRSPTF